MKILQFLGPTPVITGSGTVVIGAHEVPYVDLRPETAPALEVLLERLPPASPDSCPGLRLIALVSPQGTDALAQTAAGEGVAVIAASAGDSATEQTLLKRGRELRAVIDRLDMEELGVSEAAPLARRLRRAMDTPEFRVPPRSA